MKKAIIGSAFLLSGVLITLSILIIGVVMVPTVGSWNGSRLLTTLAEKELTLPFVIGFIFCMIGLLFFIAALFFDKD